jgi:hypothetical protein
MRSLRMTYTEWRTQKLHNTDILYFSLHIFRPTGPSSWTATTGTKRYKQELDFYDIWGIHSGDYEDFR